MVEAPETNPAPDRILASTCEECSTRCGSLIHMSGEDVVRISGNPAHPHSQGAFCVKGMNAPLASRAHPDRPLFPQRRMGERGAGQWERISWDEAFAQISKRIGEVKAKYGGPSIAGAVSSQLVNRGVAMSLLLRSLGSPNCMINQDLCQGGRLTAGKLTGLGGEPGVELKNARCIMVAGKSPSDSNVVQWMHIKAAKQQGAKLIVIDPRRTKVAELADLWLQPNPGTDAALALGMVHVLFSQSLIDKDFVRDWCLGAEELLERTQRYDPQYVSKIAKVPADDIVRAARMLATESPSSMVLGHGMDAHANNVGTAMAFHAVVALTGNIGRIGTNRLANKFPGFRDYVSVVNDPAFRLPADIEQKIIGGSQFPFWCGPESWAKSAHNPSVIRAINTGDPYPVRALYVSGVNIVCTYPGMQDTIAAFKKLDLLVVATDHVTPTAEFADFLLPKTNLLEEEAVFFDQGGSCLSVIQRAVPPRGEAKTDFEIAIGLRNALAARGLIDFDLFPWNSPREFIDYQIRDTGLGFDELCERGFYPQDIDREHYKKVGFGTPSKKIELFSHRLEAAGYDPLPEFQPPSYSVRDDEFDLVLMTGIRSMHFHHSRFRNQGWARKQQSAPELRIHPVTAASRGVEDDDWVKITTPNGAGETFLRAIITDQVPPHVVATGMGWWFPELPGPERGALRFNIEASVPYGPPWDLISGSAEARNCACKVLRAEAKEMPNNNPATEGEQR